MAVHIYMALSSFQTTNTRISCAEVPQKYTYDCIESDLNRRTFLSTRMTIVIRCSHQYNPTNLSDWYAKARERIRVAQKTTINMTAIKNGMDRQIFKRSKAACLPIPYLYTIPLSVWYDACIFPAFLQALNCYQVTSAHNIGFPASLHLKCKQPSFTILTKQCQGCGCC